LFSIDARGSSKSQAFSAKEWNVAFVKHQIRVVKTSTNGARLYVDGELLDTTNDLYASEGEATLVGVFGEDDKFRVEVS
jgi:hypothetical protein